VPVPYIVCEQTADENLDDLLAAELPNLAVAAAIVPEARTRRAAIP
jgi:hypothetical protein